MSDFPNRPESSNSGDILLKLQTLTIGQAVTRKSRRKETHHARIRCDRHQRRSFPYLLDAESGSPSQLHLYCEPNCCIHNDFRSVDCPTELAVGLTENGCHDILCQATSSKSEISADPTFVYNYWADLLHRKTSLSGSVDFKNGLTPDFSASTSPNGVLLWDCRRHAYRYKSADRCAMMDSGTSLIDRNIVSSEETNDSFHPARRRKNLQFSYENNQPIGSPPLLNRELPKSTTEFDMKSRGGNPRGRVNAQAVHSLGQADGDWRCHTRLQTLKLMNGLSVAPRSCSQELVGTCRSTAVEAKEDIDITVGELAGYFDEILYIPRKMSVMAESMYA